jgi:hypothetical protein
MQISLHVVAHRPDGGIDEVNFANRVREPLEEDSDVSVKEEWD